MFYRVIALLEQVMGHNFYASILVISGIVLCFHYTSLATTSYGYPIIVAYGQPETGKYSLLLELKFEFFKINFFNSFPR